MDKTAILQVVIGSLIVFITFIGTLTYKNRKSVILAFKKLFFRVLPVDFNIAFSLDFNDGLNSGNYFDQIKKNIIKSIYEANLDKQIKIKDCSTLRKFETREQAENFRNEKNIDLIIWGGFTNDNLKSKGEVVNKINLSFTYGYPGQHGDKLGKLLNFDIKSKFAQKNYWQIFENNSINDIELISDNIFNMSTYILAITLKLYGKILKSLTLFEYLYFKLEKKDNELSSKLVPHLVNCYEILALENAFNKKNFQEAIKYCNKVLSLKKKSFFALSNLAVFHYKAGNKVESNKYVQFLQKEYPNSTVTIVDVAFIKVLEKDYIGAYSLYSRLIKNKKIYFNPQEVIEFLNYEYEKSKEPALLFASGILAYYYSDRESGRNDLEQFLTKAKSKDYNPMLCKAKKILK